MATWWCHRVLLAQLIKGTKFIYCILYSFFLFSNLSDSIQEWPELPAKLMMLLTGRPSCRIFLLIMWLGDSSFATYFASRMPWRRSLSFVLDALVHSLIFSLFLLHFQKDLHEGKRQIENSRWNLLDLSFISSRYLLDCFPSWVSFFLDFWRYVTILDRIWSSRLTLRHCSFGDDWIDFYLSFKMH